MNCTISYIVLLLHQYNILSEKTLNELCFAETIVRVCYPLRPATWVSYEWTWDFMLSWSLLGSLLPKKVFLFWVGNLSGALLHSKKDLYFSISRHFTRSSASILLMPLLHTWFCTLCFRSWWGIYELSFPLWIVTATLILQAMCSPPWWVRTKRSTRISRCCWHFVAIVGKITWVWCLVALGLLLKLSR